MEYPYKDTQILGYLIFYSIVISICIHVTGVEYGLMIATVILSYVLDLYLQNVYTKILFGIIFVLFVIVNSIGIYNYEENIFHKIVMGISLLLTIYFTTTNHYRYWNNQGFLVFLGIFTLYSLNIPNIALMLSNL